ncbi:hypothetical protein BT96DRAFT_591645 [Gymnopus androsaceus JB14]|uniref:Uncharacterized protein n=1 Tax=Gymnopus androsaceus JB14 TaxID=1447944 RepID=A0A6A4II71_9AGAR|nr:hypothetical protein BT96DRAFT_591645 [Gymnopus androsaceus JB14]
MNVIGKSCLLTGRSGLFRLALDCHVVCKKRIQSLTKEAVFGLLLTSVTFSVSFSEFWSESLAAIFLLLLQYQQRRVFPQDLQRDNLHL